MNVLIFGATGMVGIEVLHQALESPEVDKVISVGRSEIDVESPKLTQVSHTNYLDYSSLTQYIAEADICFYCIGVYQTKVDKATFWKVTVDYLEALIDEISRTNKSIRFCLFSAQGASIEEKSVFLFANAKGRAEKILMGSAIERAYIFRPGFIQPGRKAAFGGIMLYVYQLFYALFSALGVDAENLAKVMIRVALDGSDQTIFENKDIRLLSC